MNILENKFSLENYNIKNYTYNPQKLFCSQNEKKKEHTVTIKTNIRIEQCKIFKLKSSQ